ncbi:uncharacterized protein V1516DRAFT_661760 [Lipomyces oligophaga]|uniref:uncharacterized protein n=1 Tax=Lipomyces oligophaga TaxID=45792 RepID=UPI0034CE7BF9
MLNSSPSTNSSCEDPGEVFEVPADFYSEDRPSGDSNAGQQILASAKKSASATDRFYCDVCGASYARSGHLRRHMVTHSGEKNFLCEFCGRPFHRVDIARRHSLTCPSRGENQDLSIQRRGKKRKACDACARSKIACDSAVVCKNCTLNGIKCTYFRLDDQHQGLSYAAPRLQKTPTHSPEDLFTAADIDEAGESTIGDTKMAHSNDSNDQLFSVQNDESEHLLPIKTDQPQVHIQSSTYQAPFLINFAMRDSRTRTMPLLFNGFLGGPTDSGSGAQPDSYMQDFGSQNGPSDYLLPDEATVGADGYLDMFQLSGNTGELSTQTRDSDRQQPADYDWINILNTNADEKKVFMSIMMMGDYELLSARLVELISELCAGATSTLPGMTRTPFNVFLSTAKSLLTVENVQKFVQNYFRYWHPHVSMIHAPTFGINTVSLPLLLTVCLIGSLYSSELSHRISVRNLFDASEQYIFKSGPFQELSSKFAVQDIGPGTTAQIEAVQAAYMISLVQCFNGPMEAQRHIRRRCFDDLVAAVRCLRLARTRNRFFETAEPCDLDRFDWQEYINDEVRIRIAAHVQLLDSHFTIFHNMPSRFTIAELVGDMPSAEESFNAPSEAFCYLHACEEHGRRPPSLAQSMSFLVDGRVSDCQVFDMLEWSSILNLFQMIHAIHVMLFCGRAMMIASPAAGEFHMALRRWRAIWAKRTKELTEEQRSMIGFTKNSEEYCVLAERLVAAVARGYEMVIGEGTEQVDVDNSTHVGQLLIEFENLQMG